MNQSQELKVSRIRDLVNKSYGEYVVSERWKSYRPAEYFEYRKKWYEYPEKMILEQFPIHLDIEITSYCNLGCTMCPRTVQIKEGIFGQVKHMDFELFKKLIDEGASNGLSSVKFNYLGEPLMHPNIVEMVKYCKDKGIIEVMFNTNGVLLSEQMSRDLLEAGIDSLFVSFDSADKERFEAIRIGAKYEKLLENMRTFAEIRNSDERFWHIQFRVSKVLFPDESEKEVGEFIRLFEEFVDAIGFGLLEDTNRPEAIPYDPSYRCDQLWQRLFIRQNGVAFPCCLDYKNEYIVGNASQQTLKEIWEGEPYRKLRDAHANGRYYEIDLCKNCTYLCDTKIKVETVTSNYS